MGQDIQVAQTTGTRRVLHALRPFLLLCGFVLAWLCLSIGTAQADSGPHLGVDATRTLAATAERAHHQPVHRTADHAQRTTHSAVTKTRRHAASLVKPAVHDNPAESVVSQATHTVGTSITHVVEQTREAPASTPLGSAVKSELKGSKATEETLPLVVESSTLQRETRSSRSISDPSASTSVAPMNAAESSPTEVVVSTLPSEGQAVPSTPVEERSAVDAVIPAGTSGGSSAQSGSGSGAGAALCESGPIIAPATMGSSRSSVADGRPTGPAYTPGSSPG